MAIDTSMYRQASPASSGFDPLAIGRYNIQRDLAAQQMAQQQAAMRKQDMEMADAAELKGLMRQGGGEDATIQRLVAAGRIPEANALREQKMKLGNAGLDQQSKQFGLLQEGAGLIAAAPNEQNALSVIDRLSATTGMNLDNEKREIMAARGDPARIRELAMRWGVDIKQALPQITNVTTGATNEQRTIDPITGQITNTVSTPMQLSPSDILADKRANQQLGIQGANLDIARQRLALDQRKAEQDSVAERKLALKAEADEKKEKLREQRTLSTADIILGKVDDALKDTDRMTSGLIGAGMSKIPGTRAYDLDKTIDTIKSKIGTGELQAMREASPTGGALGQVSDFENRMLQAAIASLDIGQSAAQQQRHLKEVQHHYQNIKKLISGEITEEQAAKMVSGNGGGRRVELQTMPKASSVRKGAKLTMPDGSVKYSNGSEWVDKL